MGDRRREKEGKCVKEKRRREKEGKCVKEKRRKRKDDKFFLKVGSSLANQ
jgi:hypothetical protein